MLVFFYGSYMNRAVLREVGLAPRRFEVASLAGFDVRIAPRANLVRSSSASVFGVLASATHPELERLYAHARDARTTRTRSVRRRAGGRRLRDARPLLRLAVLSPRRGADG